MNNISYYVKKTIRQCWGLDENDSSRDIDMERVDRMRAFMYVCQWELGDPGWAETIKLWLNECGLEIKEQHYE